MTRYSFGLLVLAISTAWSPAQEKVTYPKADIGPNKTATILLDWKDAKRDRHVPVKIYFPTTSTKDDETWPVIVFSHGLGGTRENYGYLGTFWASHGYVSVHLQHVGSDASAFKGATNKTDLFSNLKKAANAKNALDRPKDVSFALDEIAKLNDEQRPFKGKLRLDAVGLAGHSFGAQTTLVSAGQSLGGLLGKKFKLKDGRIKAIIPMSAPVPAGKDLDGVYADIKTPTMHMTGTLDDSPIGDTKAADRRVPFDKMKGVDQWFLNFEGGDHMIFSGRMAREGSDTKKSDAEFQRLIRHATLAFWDAHLRGDTSAKAWLEGSGFEQFLGTQAKLERKSAKK